MRGTVTDLGTPYPLGGLLPAVLQEDPFAMRLTAGLDDVLAPIIATLDCLYGYIDPALAPEDFLEWLADWVGATVDENWPLHRQRATVARAVELYQLRGTLVGLRAQVEVITGAQVDIVESGGVGWSTTPDGPLPGEPGSWLVVRITTAAPDSIRLGVVEAIVAAAKPAHVLHQIEVVQA